MASKTCTYRPPASRPLSQIGMAALLAGAVAIGGPLAPGIASAAPQQGGISPSQPDTPPQQGGITPTQPESPQQQGGITPTQPAPAPEPAPVAPPSYTPGPMGLPSAPSAPPSQHTAPETPNYEGDYSPVPVAPIHSPDPTAPKVKRPAPPKKSTLLLGNFERDYDELPDFPNKQHTIDWANGWNGYASQEIANFMISIGVPEDEAVRQTAAIVTGAAAGGLTGAAVGFTATTIFVGVFAVPIGAGIGAGIGSMTGNPFSILGGAGLGAAAGAGVAIASGLAVGTATAITGALIGAGAGYVLGAGDPGGKYKRPGDNLPKPEERGKHRQADPAPLPNPGGNQFEVHLPKEDAQRAGLPPVDYVVNKGGDVQVNVGGTKIGWTAEQAQAPIKALGPAAPAAEKAINDVTRSVSNQAQQAIKGLQVNWPQLQAPGQQGAKKPASAGKHGR
ncbi:hypothetical protein [Gordonia aichiensis]|uniref:hypothetical protein n=1 Tax=Gordonia aichiensis TaxID=36820 RepID=UPI0032635C32